MKGGQYGQGMTNACWEGTDLKLCLGGREAVSQGRS